ncbi:MAG: Do family serine endopeptidase [Bacteroidota bacterium]
MTKRIAGVFLLSMLGAMSGMGIYEYFFSSKEVYYVSTPPVQPVSSRYAPQAERNVSPSFSGNNLPDFVEAADLAKPAVVHIRSIYDAKRKSRQADFFSNPWHDYFDDDMYNGNNGAASGSGVILSSDGYIITNNHVIENANRIEVTLSDNRSFPAKLIGTDANTDLAVLKVDGEKLPSLNFGNSDRVRVGEWVLAVGNPMDLNSTVTAGIVSAKGRDINLLRDDAASYPIESFIQTDAAVNRGNSGGALINDRGELIGINTAIASRTGFYAGYSFAIPASIAKKVMEDLITYGTVKRGILGVNIQAVDASLAEKYDLKTLQGAYIVKVLAGSGAQEAGIRVGDIIISVNEVPVNSTPELQEQVSRYRPGENIEVKVFRKGDEKIFNVALQSIDGKNERSYRSGGRENIQFRGNSFRMPNEEELEKFEANDGIILQQANHSFMEAGLENGFFIQEINGKKVESIDQLYLLLLGARKSLTISGLTPEGKSKSYDIDW